MTNKPNTATSEQYRMKHLHKIVAPVGDGKSYVFQNDAGEMIFLDAKHIHRLDELMDMCLKKKNVGIKLCKIKGCPNKAIFGASGRPNNPIACHQHKKENQKHTRCDVASCQERCFMVVDGKHLCPGHVFLNGKPSTASDPDVLHNFCPLCRKHSTYGIETKRIMCSSLARIVTTLLGTETKDVVNQHCGQLVSGNPCRKLSYYKHGETNELYCISCAKSSGTETWDKLIYTGSQECVMCHKQRGKKKDAVSGNYVCGQCIDAYTEKYPNAQLVQLNKPL